VRVYHGNGEITFFKGDQVNTTTVPTNNRSLHHWALAILEKFDLPRYQAAYKLPLEEYQAIARDLPVVLQGLRDYLHDRLAPPIDETNWGYSDQ